jgi:phosphoglycolate phosphatase
MLTIDLIVFDLDGTLADSLPDLTVAANYACRRLGLPEHPAAAVKEMIGGGEAAFVGRFLGPQGQEHFEAALELYLEHYSEHCGDLTRLYPGVMEVLQSLSATGKTLALLSNKRQSLSEKVLRVMGISGFFAAVRGGGSELALKPSPEPLAALMGELGREAGRTLMVGDKPADILSARGAGALVAAVTYGYGDPAALRAAAPDFLLADLRELLALVS